MVGTLLSVELDGSLGILPLGHGKWVFISWPGRCNREVPFEVGPTKLMGWCASIYLHAERGTGD